MPQLIPYDENLHKADYERLNREWIEREFAIEPHDEAIFASPKKYIVDRGGYIFMAEHEGRIVGTCSAIRIEDGIWELAKLGVTSSAQGLGLGRALCEKIISKRERAGASAVLITTNTKLETAMRLYEKLGFVESPRSYHDHYKRCNKTLILPLK